MLDGEQTQLWTGQFRNSYWRDESWGWPSKRISGGVFEANCFRELGQHFTKFHHRPTVATLAWCTWVVHVELQAFLVAAMLALHTTFFCYLTHSLAKAHKLLLLLLWCSNKKFLKKKHLFSAKDPTTSQAYLVKSMSQVLLSLSFFFFFFFFFFSGYLNWAQILIWKDARTEVRMEPVTLLAIVFNHLTTKQWEKNPLKNAWTMPPFAGITHRSNG